MRNVAISHDLMGVASTCDIKTTHNNNNDADIAKVSSVDMTPQSVLVTPFNVLW